MSAPAADAVIASASVLVVEDDQDVRLLITGMLEAEGMTVESAADGTAALSCAASRWPAVMVMDMGMPVLGGRDLVAALRTTYGKVPPIVLVTADGESARKARQVGAFHYLQKPFDMDELVGAVQAGLAAA